MAILFAIVNPKEGKMIEYILGLYEEFSTMYEKAKKLGNACIDRNSKLGGIECITS